MAKTINEYESLVNFLIEALNFYADGENYKENINQNNVLVSKIELDNGHQASFALKQVDIINKANEDMEEELFNESFVPDFNDYNEARLQEFIEKLKNFRR